MTSYNVHLYREMRLYFPGIDAADPEQAAATAANKATRDADGITDCDGENLAALVDVAGDDEFEQCITIDFEPEWMRKAASALLAALTAVLPYARAEAEYLNGLRADDEAAGKQADAAGSAVELAEATLARAARRPS